MVGEKCNKRSIASGLFYRGIVSYIILFFPAWVFSQTAGLVIDQQTRLPLGNVQVILPDSTMVHTNMAGIFYIPDDMFEGKLQVSHIGYVTQPYNFRKHEKILIEMLPDPKELTEVQVSATQFSGKLKNQSGNISLLFGRGRGDRSGGSFTHRPEPY